MRRVDVELDSAGYPVLIEESLLPSVGDLIERCLGPERTVVITDRNVDDLYGEKLEQSLEEGGTEFEKLVVPPGEGSKSLPVARRLYEDLAGFSLDRDSAIVAFGGGVIGDLAGFVGSTFLRGLSVVQVPTTLLAQVDSSVGGKTAVNIPQGKNLVGAFHQPELVIIDPLVLATLSPSDLRSGLGEVLKYGLIRDRELFWKVVEDGSLPQGQDDPEEIIGRCCEIKAEIVGEDERDRGLRQILNFGHTLGHGIEAGCGYGNMKHGEAVLWGMIGESWISRHRGYLREETFSKLVEALIGFGLAPLPGDLAGEKLLEYVSRDKKARGGRINSVLIQEPGEEVVVEEVSSQELVTAWEFLTGLEVERR